MNFRTAALAFSALVLSTLPATAALAQAAGRAMAAPAVSGAVSTSVAPDAIPPGADDMRLWSFGECDRRFPYVNSEEHKQCARVVGSDEARDARAYRVCDVSHERDHEEAARCKAAYKANKQKAAQDGYVPNTTAQPLAAAPPDVMQKVRAIAEAAVERDREAASAETAAAPAAADPEVEPVPSEAYEFWSPMTVVGTLSMCMLVLAVTMTIGRRKLAGLAGGE